MSSAPAQADFEEGLTIATLLFLTKQIIIQLTTIRYNEQSDHVKMSTAAKTTLATTVLGTIGIVYFVHQQQVADKAVRSMFLAEREHSLTRKF